MHVHQHMSLYVYVQWLEVRCNLFCWYWQNCWPSLFKLSSHSLSMFACWSQSNTSMIVCVFSHWFINANTENCLIWWRHRLRKVVSNTWCGVFLILLVYPMLPVSLDCSCFIVPSVFSNVYIPNFYIDNAILMFNNG